MRQVVSPGSTTGPYFPREFSDGSEDLTQRDGHTARGQHLLLTGRVLEVGAKPTWNMVLEIWQPDAVESFAIRWTRVLLRPIRDSGVGDARAPLKTVGIASQLFCRALTASAARISTARCWASGSRGVCSLRFSLPMRPMRSAIRCWIASPIRRARRRLFAKRDASLDAEGLPAYRFDIILRGEGETPFFVD